MARGRGNAYSLQWKLENMFSQTDAIWYRDELNFLFPIRNCMCVCVYVASWRGTENWKFVLFLCFVVVARLSLRIRFNSLRRLFKSVAVDDFMFVICSILRNRCLAFTQNLFARNRFRFVFYVLFHITFIVITNNAITIAVSLLLILSFCKYKLRMHPVFDWNDSKMESLLCW